MEESSSNNKNKILYVIIGLLGLAVLFLTYKLTEKQDVLTELNDNNTVLSTERDELEDQLMEMLQQYDTLNVEGEEMKAEILQQKEEISALLERVQKLKNDDSALRWEIDKLKKETGTLRTIMKGYLFTIDSLNQENDSLTRLSDKLEETVVTVTQKYQDQQVTLEDQANLIKTGSVLTAVSFTAEAIRVKSSGAEKATPRASRAEMIKACVKLGQNKITKKGPKTLYIRVISPEGVVLDDKNNMGKTFNFNNVSGKYSAKRQLEYNGNSQDICVFHTITKELTAGQYIVEMYESGVLIGKSTFDLR